MKIPKKINIAGIDIRIVFNQLDGICGEYIHAKSLIKIDPTIEKSLQVSTFIHEVTEAINIIYDVGLEHHQVLLIEAAFNDLGIKIKEKNDNKSKR